jgi:hypothetical protein
MINEWKDWIVHKATFAELADTWSSYVKEASAIAGKDLRAEFFREGRLEEFLKGSSRCVARGLSPEKFSLFAVAALDLDAPLVDLMDEVEEVLASGVDDDGNPLGD